MASVRSVASKEGVHFHLEGLDERVDLHTLASCLNAVANCAEVNQCLERGLALSSECLQTIVGHELLAGCASDGFGLSVEPGRRAKASVGGSSGLHFAVVPGASALHLTGARSGAVDHALLAECINVAVRCAAENACLERGLNMTAACVETLTGHQQADQCMAKGFGLARVS